MLFFKTLSFFWFFVTALSGPVQVHRADITQLVIPAITLDDRKNCGVEKFLLDKNITTESSPCNFVLPIDNDNYYKVSPATLCFGVYDTLYELCKFQNLSTLEIPQIPIDKFCRRASKSLDNYNFLHRHPIFPKWTPHVRAGLSDIANCSEICTHRLDVNPFCSVIVAALERLPAALAMATTSHSNPSSATQSLREKGSTPSAVQGKPASPTKDSVLVPDKVKTPEPAESVVAEPNVNPEEETVPKAAAVEKSPPPPEPEKPEQMAKPEEKLPMNLPIEPNNPDNPDADIMGMAGAEEDEDPLPEHQPVETSVTQLHENGVKDESMKFAEDETKGKQENLIPGPADNDGSTFLTLSNDDSEDTNMVTYFVLMTGGALLFYVAFHNKNKLLALALEGRRTGRRGGRHSASYSKLHSNLEETISAGPASPSATHVLY